VKTVGVPYRHDIVEVQDGLPAHISHPHSPAAGSVATFQPQSRTESPVRLKVATDLPIDRTDRTLHGRVGEPPVGSIDDGDDHAEPLLLFYGDRVALTTEISLPQKHTHIKVSI
jgi:hypothetical protein